MLTKRRARVPCSRQCKQMVTVWESLPRSHELYTKSRRPHGKFTWPKVNTANSLGELMRGCDAGMAVFFTSPCMLACLMKDALMSFHSVILSIRVVSRIESTAGKEVGGGRGGGVRWLKSLSAQLHCLECVVCYHGNLKDRERWISVRAMLLLVKQLSCVTEDMLATFLCCVLKCICSGRALAFSQELWCVLRSDCCSQARVTKRLCVCVWARCELSLLTSSDLSQVARGYDSIRRTVQPHAPRPQEYLDLICPSTPTQYSTHRKTIAPISSSIIKQMHIRVISTAVWFLLPKCN